ncbi:MAG: DUF6933 domain-containing protein [Proteocatella sp.]
MQICCTKKLTAVSGVDVDKDYSEENDFYIWSANIVSVDFRKLLVAVNDRTHFGFVKYGIEIEEFKNLESYIESGIRKAFKDENIDDEVIERYFKKAGDLVFSWTKGPVHVSRLNRVVLRAESFAKHLDRGSIFQPKITKLINGHFDTYGETEIPYQNLLRAFKDLE